MIFHMQTIQGVPFKHVVESMKDILSDAVFHISKDGMKISTLDYSKTAIVNVTIDASMCETFVCAQPHMTVGVSMSSMYRLLRGLSQADVLTLSSTHEKPETLCICCQSPERRMNTTSKLNTLDLEDEIVEIPAFKSQCTVLIPSMEFQRSIRDMSQISDVVRITVSHDTLEMTATGDFAMQRIALQERTNGMQFSVPLERGQKISEVFAIKYILLFSKSANTSPVMSIRITEGMPLCLEYGIGTIGHMVFMLSARIEP